MESKGMEVTQKKQMSLLDKINQVINGK
jgi:hypothetical protein